VGIFLSSCQDDDLDPVLQLNAIPAITAPADGALLELTEATAAEVLPDFTWSAADYGFPAGISYKLEIDLEGNDFAEAVAIGTVNALKISGMTQGDLNNILLAKELEGETPSTVELRVTATVSPDVAPLYSNVVTITVIPYSAFVVIPQLQVPGSYQGWDPANNSTVIFSPKSDNKYEGYLYFPDDNAFFKYTLGPSWDTNWGDDGGDGSLEPGGLDIANGPAGVYKLNVNLNELSHTKALTSWGLIGNATPTGWDSDTDLTFDPGTNVYSLTLDLIVGAIKFRANDAWDINLGDDGPNTVLEYGGADIMIEVAGNYTVELLIVGVPKYKFKITKN
jgi:hypothetical protein